MADWDYSNSECPSLSIVLNILLVQDQKSVYDFVLIRAQKMTKYTFGHTTIKKDLDSK